MSQDREEWHLWGVTQCPDARLSRQLVQVIGNMTVVAPFIPFLPAHPHPALGLLHSSGVWAGEGPPEASLPSLRHTSLLGICWALFLEACPPRRPSPANIPTAHLIWFVICLPTARICAPGEQPFNSWAHSLGIWHTWK